MNQLTDEQQNLLKFLPDGFYGTKLEKLTMAAFCYCSQSAIERGENQFSLGLIGLKDLTGYNSISKLSIAVKNLISNGYITCLKRGNGIEHINSVYQMKRESMEEKEGNMEKYKRESMETKMENMEGKTNNNNNNKNNNNNNNNLNYSTNTNSTVDYTDIEKERNKNNINNYTETNSTIDDSTEREKERNNNNTLNSTTDMLMFTERLVLLSKEIEAMKAENESLKVDIKSLKDDNKTLNERLNKAAKIIKELKEEVNTLHNSTDSTKEVNLNDSEIWNLRREFSDQLNIAKNPNANSSERLMAAKIMNSIADKHPDILTENQRKAARNTLSYLNKNTNVESKPNTKDEVIGLKKHSFTKESAYTFNEWKESYNEFRVASGDTDVTKDELKEKAHVLVNKSNEVKAYIDSGEVPNKFIAEFKKATEPQDGLMDFEYDKALKLAEEETQE